MAGGARYRIAHLETFLENYIFERLAGTL
jgi:hypothetical protein